MTEKIECENSNASKIYPIKVRVIGQQIAGKEDRPGRTFYGQEAACHSRNMI